MSSPVSELKRCDLKQCDPCPAAKFANVVPQLAQRAYPSPSCSRCWKRMNRFDSLALEKRGSRCGTLLWSFYVVVDCCVAVCRRCCSGDFGASISRRPMGRTPSGVDADDRCHTMTPLTSHPNRLEHDWNMTGT